MIGNSFVDNIYNFITGTASLTGSNSLPFRGMVFDISNSFNTDNVETPSGIYQMPTGYVQGFSNGTPLSPLEEIWVLRNQYGHTWSYQV